MPPLASFGDTPAIVITLDRRVLTGGAVPAIFPGPLVSPIVQRQLTPAGWTRIVEGARAGGLLTDGPPIGDLAPGETVLLLRIVADGRLHVVTGSNRAAGCLSDPCQGPPGTLAALQGYVGRLMDLSWLATDVGQEAPYLPESYGVVVGPVPDDQGLPQPPIGWPFADGFDAFGEPLADGSGFRCGAVSGDDAATLRAGTREGDPDHAMARSHRWLAARTHRPAVPPRRRGSLRGARLARRAPRPRRRRPRRRGRGRGPPGPGGGSRRAPRRRSPRPAARRSRRRR